MRVLKVRRTNRRSITRRVQRLAVSTLILVGLGWFGPGSSLITLAWADDDEAAVNRDEESDDASAAADDEDDDSGSGNDSGEEAAKEDSVSEESGSESVAAEDSGVDSGADPGADSGDDQDSAPTVEGTVVSNPGTSISGVAGLQTSVLGATFSRPGSPEVLGAPLARTGFDAQTPLLAAGMFLALGGIARRVSRKSRKPQQG